jgi:hypothetical protein
MVVSLLIHRQGLSTMGFHRVHHAWTPGRQDARPGRRLSVLDIGLLKPVENHLTGVRQDMSQFHLAQGSRGHAHHVVVLAWVCRGGGRDAGLRWVRQTRITEVLGSTGARLGPWCCPQYCSACCTPSTGSSVVGERGQRDFYCVLRGATTRCGRRSWRTGSSTPSAWSASSSSDRSTGCGEPTARATSAALSQPRLCLSHPLGTTSALCWCTCWPKSGCCQLLDTMAAAVAAALVALTWWPACLAGQSLTRTAMAGCTRRRGVRGRS